jgi:hypothetical protein
MKPSIKYIGLLLVGGLMFVFYFNAISDKIATDKTCLYQSQDLAIRQCRNEEHSFSFFKDVIANILPVLKMLSEQPSIKSGH